jgi:uncharacterized protein (TIGR03437 family)
VDGQLATDTGGLRVTFDGTPAPILYARFDQVGVVVPFEVSGKTAVAVQATTATGQTTASFQQAIGPTSPAIFTAASNGNGQASVINETGAVNGATTAALKGSTVSIYLTGAGQMVPAGKTGATGAINQTIAAPVTVRIGGQEARVVYAGAAPTSVQGLYQINAVVPQGASTGSVPVEVTVGNVTSRAAVTMYVQ